jgi:hypothetical protein
VVPTHRATLSPDEVEVEVEVEVEYARRSMTTTRAAIFVALAACAPAAPTIATAPAASSSVVAPPPAVSASASASASAAPSSAPPTGDVNVTFEMVPAIAPESTPRELFLVVPEMSLRERIATYTLPDHCFTERAPRPRAEVPQAPSAPTTSKQLVVTCTRSKSDGATVTFDGAKIVVRTANVVREATLVAGSKVIFGELSLPKRDCAQAPAKGITVAIRRHARAADPPSNEPSKAIGSRWTSKACRRARCCRAARG